MKNKNLFQDFEPFGSHWKAEMNKWTKKHLIDFLAKNLVEKQRLKIALQDAIRRPLGVVPDSAAEFLTDINQDV